MTRRSTISALLCVALMLAACGDRDGKNGDADGNNASAKTLPAPQGTRGSVTGMPDTPGPGQVGPPASDALPPETPISSDAEDGMPADADADGVSLPASAEESSSDVTPTEPTPQDAAVVIQEYYTAINAGNFSGAYALWADGASGKTPRQFADGFADTNRVMVTIGAPGQVDAAAGSRYIEVPVAISATQRDDSVRQYVGTYTLRRAVVDGATAEQRAWRIASAEIRAVTPDEARP